LMHQQDLEGRPEWAQQVVNGLVEAQAWVRSHRSETATLLSRRAPGRYTPHSEDVLKKVLAPDAEDRAFYEQTGAIKHQEWPSQRIDFQPFPFPSYTERMVELLKNTYVEDNSKFIANLALAAVAKDLVDDRFVKQAIANLGG